MVRAWILIFLLPLCFADDYPYLSRLRFRDSGGNEDQAKAAWEVINRLIPDKSDRFKTFIGSSNSETDSFSIVKVNDNIEITGSSGVAISWGFNYYLKNYCNSHVGWQVKQISIPDVLPSINITIHARDRLRYYQNVCTTSYSFAWWDIEKWRQHIDWMAMNGINVALAPHGQEAIWLKVYKSLNLTDEEILEHFPGPAFLSWQRMGNIRGWGGPLSVEWHQHSLQLEGFIISAMNKLGMIPALPAFAGFVPNGLKRVYPDAKISPTQQWNGFESKYCCPLYLDPTDPLFGKIGTLFLSEITSQFGTSHLYYSDPFNEIKPASDDEDFLKNVGAGIFKTMTDIDPDAIWLLQNWMFVHDSLYWTKNRTKAFLTSISTGRMLILDLQSEQWPQYEKHEMYYRQPFIWCMLHNFGGTLGMFGNTHSINNDIYKARMLNHSTMVGIGLTPEGINQNYVLYDLVLESSLRSESVNISQWISKYAERRYGKSNKYIDDAWNILMNTVYNFRGLNKMRGKYVITRRPSLKIKPWAWYHDTDILKTLTLFLNDCEDFNGSEGYKHDLVDITRQLLQYKADQLYVLIVEAYFKKNLTNLEHYSSVFLSIFDDLDSILSSNKDFLLSNWLESAKKLAQTSQDRLLFEYNARNQITLWGPNGEIVDYANKQYAGLIKDYYGARWKIFLIELRKSLKENKKIDMEKVQKQMFQTVEQPFTMSQKIYPLNTSGDSVVISKEILSKWLSSNSSKIPFESIFKPYIHGIRLRREFHEISEDYEYSDFFPSVILV